MNNLLHKFPYFSYALRIRPPPKLQFVDYKKLPTNAYFDFLQEMQTVKYGRKSAPKDFNFLELENHHIERINKNSDPNSSEKLIHEFFTISKGSLEGLYQINEIVNKNFEILKKDGQIDLILLKLSNWDLVQNNELLAKTNIYLKEILEQYFYRT